MNEVYSAEWSPCYEFKLTNNIIHRDFIDKGSIQETPEGTILVWLKQVSPEKPMPKEIWFEELREVDCSRRRYKMLQGYIFLPEYREVEPYGWTYFTPADESIALFNAVCGKGKKK